MVRMVTRWNSYRLDAKLTRAIAEVSRGAFVGEANTRVSAVAAGIAQQLSASGRGGPNHNHEFSDYAARAWVSGAGRYNVIMGWINADRAEGGGRERGGGGKLWFQYQEGGFNMWGDPARPIPGVNATVTARADMIDATLDAAGKHIHNIKDILE